MSSLLQHHGGRSPDGRKVELLMYLVKKTPDWEKYHGPNSYNPNPEATSFTEDVELVELDGKKYPRLYRIYRRPAGMLGCWAVFRFNGEEHVPDLSVPIKVFQLPRDAKPLGDDEALKYWKS